MKLWTARIVMLSLALVYLTSLVYLAGLKMVLLIGVPFVGLVLVIQWSVGVLVEHHVEKKYQKRRDLPN